MASAHTSPRVAVPKIFETGYRTAAKRNAATVGDISCAMQNLHVGSEADSDGVPLTPVTSDKTKAKAVQAPVGTPSSTPRPHLNQVLTKDNANTRTRYFAIGPIARDADIDAVLQTLLTKHGWARKVILPRLMSNPDNESYTLLGACDDTRDVDSVSTQAAEMFKGAQASPSIQYDRYVRMASEDRTRRQDCIAHEAEVLVVAMYQGTSINFQSEGYDVAQRVIWDAATKFAHGAEGVVGLRLYSIPDGVTLRFKLEFSSVKDAKTAISYGTLPCAGAQGWMVSVKAVPYQSPAGSDESEDQSKSSTSRNGSQAGMYTSSTGRSRWEIDAEGKQKILSPERVVAQGQVPPTPTGDGFGSGPVVVHAGQQQLIPIHHGQVMQHQQMGPVSAWIDTFSTKPTSENASQVVSTPKILAGFDVRTTLMLRNIPNKLTCWDLKARLDEFGFGEFDFLYLRIDFSKDANVGYGFVNFTDPRSIVKLMNNLSGQPWIPGTKRMCQVSYATIQGIDCLRQKFRNSAIMEEAPDYRPKMFYTVDDVADGVDRDLLGQEKPFPPPDNEYKKARSMDNAASSGLYPAKHLAQRQRTYQSQYDRGTPAQVREEQMGVQPPPFFAVQPYYAPQFVGPQYGYHAGPPPTPGMHPGAAHPRHINNQMQAPMGWGAPQYVHHAQYAPVTTYSNGHVVYAMAPPQHGEWYPA